MLPELQKLIDLAVRDKAFFKPTDIFNEGFLLKILFQFAIENPDVIYSSDKVNLVMSHSPETKFFCEGQLYTHFRHKLDSELYEKDTHADGVIGHFKIGEDTKTRIIALPDARKFVVTEAKLNSRLSEKVTKAPFYDQAARNVACIAETLFDAKLKPSKLDRIGFYLLVPKQKINKKNFDKLLKPESIKKKVLRRIEKYGPNQRGDLEKWHKQWFLPTMNRIIIEKISWEEIIENIIEIFPKRTDIDVFYQHCLKHNDLLYNKDLLKS